MHILHSLVLLYCVLALQRQVHADYELTVQVFRYLNPSHGGLEVPDGECCEEDCEDSCQNRLTFCLRPTGTSALDPTQCSGGYPPYTTVIPGTDNDVFLRGFLLGLPNPLTFTGDVWPGSAQLFIVVEDVASDEDGSAVLIDRLFIEVQRAPGSGFTAVQTHTGAGGFATITLRYQVRCLQNSSGSQCTSDNALSESNDGTSDLTSNDSGSGRASSNSGSSADAGTVAGAILAAMAVLSISTVTLTVILVLVGRRLGWGDSISGESSTVMALPGDNPTYAGDPPAANGATHTTTDGPDTLNESGSHRYEYVSSQPLPGTHSHTGAADGGSSQNGYSYAYTDGRGDRGRGPNGYSYAYSGAPLKRTGRSGYSYAYVGSNRSVAASTTAARFSGEGQANQAAVVRGESQDPQAHYEFSTEYLLQRDQRN